MNPRVKTLEVKDNYILELGFTNGEKGIFSVEPYLSYPVYEPLKDKEIFKRATVSFGFVNWNGEIDIDPDTLYLESKKIA